MRQERRGEMGAHHTGGGPLLQAVPLVGPLCQKPRARCRMQLFGLCAVSVRPEYLIFCLCSFSVPCLGWLEEKLGGGMCQDVVVAACSMSRW